MLSIKSDFFIKSLASISKTDPWLFLLFCFALVWGGCKFCRCIPWLLVLTVHLFSHGCLPHFTENAWYCMCFILCCGLCYIIFLLPDSGGCARKRAAMSVTLTSVKRVQSSPNLLAAGIISLTHRMSYLNAFLWPFFLSRIILFGWWKWL